MGQITFADGDVCLFDDADAELINKFIWHRRLSGGIRYAQAHIEHKGRRNSIQMHQLLMGTFKTGQEVDHINHDGLDNRRSNLRIVTQQQNSWNSRVGRKRALKGIHKNHNKWDARIGLNGKQIYLGLFGSMEDAARRYDKAAIEYFGQYAALNFPIQWEEKEK